MDLSLACVGEKPSGKEGQRPALETFARRCANRTRWVVRGSRLLTRGLDVDAKHQTCRFVSACARAAPLQGSTRTFAPLRLCVRFSSTPPIPFRPPRPGARTWRNWRQNFRGIEQRLRLLAPSVSASSDSDRNAGYEW